MKNYPLWKIFVVFVLVSLGVVFAIPSILYQEDTGNWYLDNRLNLGLDLQGGSYLLLEVQTDVLIEEEFENFSDTIRLIARENRIKINNIKKIDEELKVAFDSSGFYALSGRAGRSGVGLTHVNKQSLILRDLNHNVIY